MSSNELHHIAGGMTRVAGFAVLLAVVFGVALLVGREYGPDLDTPAAGSSMGRHEGDSSMEDGRP